MNEKLVKILEESRNNQLIRKKFLEIRNKEDPMGAFCNVATSMGYDYFFTSLN
ncbi:hypothetical protein [Terrisporobacter mayombei]|uniref:hypothetical protein n=1 Tax=Terrisporobacter mayombei TaxID=1541 RepID=UPI001D1610FC|nr:hypothetical protein [Terrisporobacter mayombei]MCC3869322.1 hypothetical protein [Terrisporobacter mayombei]